MKRKSMKHKSISGITDNLKFSALNTAGIISAIGILALPAILTLTPVISEYSPALRSAYADSYDLSTAAVIESKISLATDSVTINLDPTSESSVFETGASTATVTTNNSTGYTLYLTDKDDNTDLKHTQIDTAKIKSIENNVAVSEDSNTNFPVNSWGYSLDGTNYKPIPIERTKINSRTTMTPTGGEATTVTYGVKADMSIPSGTYKDTLLISAVSNYTREAYENQNLFVDPETGVAITKMQEMTPEVCANVPTIPARDSGGNIIKDVPETTLTDTRDGNTYKVRKLADGECWMSEDLKIDASKFDNYDSSTNIATLTASDTNISQNASIFPAVNTSGFTKTFTKSVILRGGDVVLYNFHAAVAEQDGVSVDGTDNPNYALGREIAHDICPRGWRIPAFDADKSLYWLFVKYGIVSSGHYAIAETQWNELLSAPLSFEANGMFEFTDSAPKWKGNDIMLWYARNDAGNSSLGNYTDIWPTEVDLFRSSRGNKQNGYAVRCVAK